MIIKILGVTKDLQAPAGIRDQTHIDAIAAVATSQQIKVDVTAIAQSVEANTQTATAAASQAAQDAQATAQDATTASNAASVATQAKTAAETAAQAAATSETNSDNSAQAAAISASNADTAVNAAAVSEQSALASKTSAENSALAAASLGAVVGDAFKAWFDNSVGDLNEDGKIDQADVFRWQQLNDEEHFTFDPKALPVDYNYTSNTPQGIIDKDGEFAEVPINVIPLSGDVKYEPVDYVSWFTPSTWNLNSNWTQVQQNLIADGTSSSDANHGGFVAKIGRHYKVKFTVESISAGSVYVQIGSGKTSVATAVGTYEEVVYTTTDDRPRVKSSTDIYFAGEVSSILIEEALYGYVVSTGEVYWDAQPTRTNLCNQSHVVNWSNLASSTVSGDTVTIEPSSYIYNNSGLLSALEVSKMYSDTYLVETTGDTGWVWLGQRGMPLWVRAWFNLDTLEVGQIAGAVSSSLEAMQNGTIKITITYIASSDATCQNTIQTVTANGVTSGSGKSIKVHHCQTEEGLGTNPIETNGSVLSRVAGYLSIPTVGNWNSQTGLIVLDLESEDWGSSNHQQLLSNAYPSIYQSLVRKDIDASLRAWDGSNTLTATNIMQNIQGRVKIINRYGNGVQQFGIKVGTSDIVWGVENEFDGEWTDNAALHVLYNLSRQIKLYKLIIWQSAKTKTEAKILVEAM